MKAALQTMVIHKAIDDLGIYEALKKAKEIGYSAFEISGHFNCDDSVVAELCRAREELGIEICALNVVYTGGYETEKLPGSSELDVVKNYDKAVSYAKKLGCKYLRYMGAPAERLKTVDDVRSYFEELEKLCVKLAEDDLFLCMHNHYGEFAKVGGKMIHDWAVEVAPHLCFEFDVAGMVRGAVDLQDQMEKLKGRMPLAHFTDIKVIPRGHGAHLEEAAPTCPPGEGNVNVRKFCEGAKKAGNEYLIVEFSRTADPYAAAQFAAESIKNAGFADIF